MDTPDTPLEQLPLVPAEKRCGTCGRLLPLEAFGRHKKAKDGLNWWCKDCNNANGRAYYAAHRRQKIAYQRAYYAANKDAINAAVRAERRRLREDAPAAWHARNKEHYRRYGKESSIRARLWHAQHPERRRAHKNNYYRRHREYWRALSTQRRVRLRRIPGHWTAQDIALIHSAQRGCCAYCLAPLGVTFHRDHMTPVSRPGCTNDIGNICLTCAACNHAKGTRTAGEYMALLIRARRALRDQAAV